ncbi:MAG: hypothetical protein ACK2UI_03875, partial [Anaerolineae bacterium]
MFKKSLALTGTVLLASAVLLALFILLSSPETVIQAALPSECITVDHDITADTTWNAPCYNIMTTT